MGEAKHKTGDSLRTPKPKKKLGLTVPPALRMPHEDLISSAPVQPSQPSLESTIQPSLTSQTTPTSQTSTTTPTSQTTLTDQDSDTSKQELPVSPQRDYTKVANSIGREAVPAGLFTGKSKQLYDCLYSLTRGAVVPRRTVRISRPRLMERAHIGARVTFDANVERLVRVGLVRVRQIVGEHEGNEYTVYLPEELQESMTSQTSQGSLTSLTDSAQKLDILVGLETSQTRHSLSADGSNIYGEPKTFFKTIEENDDDDAFGAMLSTLRQAVEEITGRPPSPGESERWRDLAELLAAELKIAASRTKVSSVPAFLTEHLRRRLFKHDRQQIEREVAEASRPEAQGQQAAQAKPHLDTDQLQEQVNMMVELIQSGRSVESLDEQFAGSFRPVQWHTIRSMALAQLRVARPPENREEVTEEGNATPTSQE